MKREFAVLVLSADAPVAGVDYPTCVPRPEPKPTPASDRLRAFAGDKGLKLFAEDKGAQVQRKVLDETTSVVLDSGNSFQFQFLPSHAVMLIGGSPSPEKLRAVCALLDDHGIDFIVVLDALDNRAELHPALMEIAEGFQVTNGANTIKYGPIQLAFVGELGGLVKARRLMVSAYPRADSTTTIVVIVDAGTPEARVLSIVRKGDPFKGCESLPGGFLAVYLEPLDECAARELREESNLHVLRSDLVLIDVRSSPERDERGHVIDHGYAWFVRENQKAAVLASVQAGDDAEPGSAKFVLVSDVLSRKIAFDHLDLLKAALARVD